MCRGFPYYNIFCKHKKVKYVINHRIVNGTSISQQRDQNDDMLPLHFQVRKSLNIIMKRKLCRKD